MKRVRPVFDPGPRSGRRPAPVAAIAVAASVLFGTPGAPASVVPQDPPAENLSSELRGTIRYHSDNLHNATATPENRMMAARFLLRLQIPQAIAVLDAALRQDDPALVQAVISALEVEPVQPTGLIDAIAVALEGASAETSLAIGGILSRYGMRGAAKVSETALDQNRPLSERLAAVRALQEFRGSEPARHGVETLITLIQPDRNEPPEVVEAALQSLRKVTSLQRFGDDTDAWIDWWRRTRNRPVQEWLPDEFQRLNERIDRIQGELETMRRQNETLRRTLDELLSNFYFELKDVSDDKAQALLAAWLRHDVAAVRQIAAARVEKRILDSTPISEEIQNAVVERLSDPLPPLRQSAARLLDRLGHPDVAALVVTALQAESDVEVQKTLLEILGRHAAPSALPTLVPLLEQPELRELAARAALTALRNADVPEETRNQLRTAARAAFEASKSPHVIRLLATVGAPEDVVEIARHLDGDGPELRAVVADAIRHRPAAEEFLLAHAEDPAIFPAAADALARGEPTLERLAQLIALSPPTPETIPAWMASIQHLCDRVAPGQLGDVEQAIAAIPPERLDPGENLRLREAILSRLIAPSTPPDAVSNEDRVRLLTILAKHREALNDPRGVVEALDRINGEGTNHDHQAMRFLALLALGAFDEAAGIHAEPANWIAALETIASRDPQAAVAVKAEIDRRFPDLDEQARKQLDAIASRLPSNEEPTNGSEPTDSDASAP